MKLKNLVNGIMILAALLVLPPAALVSATEPIDVCSIQNFTFEFEADASGNALQAGQIIDEEWAAWGIHVTTMDPVTYPAMIFDSSNPTGGDPDLGSPNQAYGGPGIGTGGAPDGGGPNFSAQDKILIISEDGNQSNPDDKGNGGTLTFTFDSPQYVREVHVLDIDEGTGNGGTIKAFDAVVGGSQIGSTAPMVRLGDNSYQVVSVQADGVRRLEIYFKGSGGVPAIGFCALTPTAVELASFTATGVDGAIHLAWETATELDNLGFNVYRSESGARARVKLNDSLIAAKAPGSNSGAGYEFVDAEVSGGKTYTYWLESLDLSGGSAEYGPVSATATATYRRLGTVRPRIEPIYSRQISR
jgi:hypothetical protein